MSQSRRAKNTQRFEQEGISSEDFKEPKIKKDIFKELEEKKAQGIWDGKVERIEFKEHSLIKGKHYYEIEDVKKRTIVCISCPVRHGGVLEAKHLLDYQIKKGVLYFKGKAVNETP